MHSSSRSAGFSVHPLQTLVRSRGPEQLDGACAAVTAETDEARERALWLAETLGLTPFDARRRRAGPLPRGRRVRVELPRHALPRRGPARSSTPARRPKGSLPLMRRTIENDFELTGPIARGDCETVERHLAAIREREPDARAALRGARGGDCRREGSSTTIADVAGRQRSRRAGDGRARADDGRAPRGPRGAVPRGARRVRRRRREPLRQPGAVRRAARPRPPTRATSTHDERARPRGRRRPRLRAVGRASSTRPASRPGSSPEGAALGLEGDAPPGPLPRRRDRLPEALHDRPARTSPTSGARTPSRSRS